MTVQKAQFKLRWFSQTIVFVFVFCFIFFFFLRWENPLITISAMNLLAPVKQHLKKREWGKKKKNKALRTCLWTTSYPLRYALGASRQSGQKGHHWHPTFNSMNLDWFSLYYMGLLSSSALLPWTMSSLTPQTIHLK